MPRDTFDDEEILIRLGAIRQKAITWASVAPDMSLYGATRPEWIDGSPIFVFDILNRSMYNPWY